MGKGDKKTRKGKIAMGSYGKNRPHSAKKVVAVSETATATTKQPAKKPSA